MDVIAENHSLYPRVGESENHLRLRQAYHKYDAGDIDQAELREIEDSYAEDVINEQINAGLDIVTDGMIRWYGHISHLAESLVGTEVAGLVRWFDTNYLVREARIEGPVEWRNPLIVPEFEFAQSVSRNPVKVVLPGPLTLARHSIWENTGQYSSEQQLAEDYATALTQEIRDLNDAGLKHLQIEEPSLLQTPEESDWVLSLINQLTNAAGDANIRLATYFGDAAPLYDELQDTKTDVLTLDFTYSDDLIDVIQSGGSDKRLGIGLLNGRNTKLEQTDDIIDTVQTIDNAVESDSHILTFSCSIDYLPRDKAQRKLEKLAEVRDQLTPEKARA